MAFRTNILIVRLQTKADEDRRRSDRSTHPMSPYKCQQQFKFYWRPGKLNYADYWTKHHSAAHHVNMRPEFLTPLIAAEIINQAKTSKVAAAA